MKELTLDRGWRTTVLAFVEGLYFNETNLVALTKFERDIVVYALKQPCGVCGLPRGDASHNAENSTHAFNSDEDTPPKRCSQCSQEYALCINPEHCNEELPPRLRPITQIEWDRAYSGATNLPNGSKPLIGTIMYYGTETEFVIAGNEHAGPNEAVSCRIFVSNDTEDRTYIITYPTVEAAIRAYEILQSQADNDNTDLVDVFGFSPE